MGREDELAPGGDRRCLPQKKNESFLQGQIDSWLESETLQKDQGQMGQSQTKGVGRQTWTSAEGPETRRP